METSNQQRDVGMAANVVDPSLQLRDSQIAVGVPIKQHPTEQSQYQRKKGQHQEGETGSVVKVGGANNNRQQQQQMQMSQYSKSSANYGGGSKQKSYAFAVKERRSKKKQSALNFSRWLLTLISIGNFVLAPLIIYMGYQAQQYDYNDLLVVDKALIILGIWVLFISVLNIISLSKDNDDLMIFIFYCCIITFIMLSVFAIGAISFSDNLIDWVDKHWEEIRASARTYSMSDFKQHVASELVSLGAFALTLDLTLFIMIATLLAMHGFEKIMIAIFPLTNLLFIVFSSAIMIIAYYSNEHTYYTSALPVWANYFLSCIALFIFVVAIFGYYSVTHGHYTFIMIYILVLGLSSFACLVTGLGMIIKTSNIKDAVSKEWPNIEQRLKASGYEISESTFANFLEVNLKFAGLFVIVFCLFLVVGLIPAVYLSFARKRSSHSKSNNNTPYRFNSDVVSPSGAAQGRSGGSRIRNEHTRNHQQMSSINSDQ